MATVFNYKARDTGTGKITRGSINANTEAEAAKLLMSQNIVPLEITSGEAGASLFASFGSRVSAKDRVVFTRQLSTMLNAGLPLAQSLATVQEQTQSRSLKTIVSGIVSDVNGGSSLGNAFAKYPKVFNQVYVALVRAGETAGTLDKSLERLADQEEHDADMLGKIRGAMYYPAIVLAVIIFVIIFMLVSLVPQVAMLYDEMHQQLPIQTVILVGVTTFLMNFWWLIILIFVGLGFVLRRWIQTDSGRKTWDSIKLNMWPFAQLFRKLYMSRFSRTSQTLLASGVPMLEVLKISADAVNNVVVKEEILRARGKVKNGKPLSEGLTGEDYILPFVHQMTKIGEQSGGIDTMLGKVADYYDKEVDAAIAAISTMIEPILMVLMGGMIAFIIFAVLVPIYALTSAAQTNMGS
jgi:type IV pilus assembly protein PilC